MAAVDISKEKNEHWFDWGLACERVQVEKKNVISVHLLGSRLWGTSNSESDFDVYIIVKDRTAIPGGGIRQCLHAGKYDAVVQTQESYFDRLSKGGFLEQIVWELTPPRSAPNVYCVVSPQQPVPHPLSLLGGSRQWRFNAITMYAKLSKTVARDWRIAEKHMSKGESAKAKKIVVHALRSLLISKQLLALYQPDPPTVDYTRGLRIWQKMNSDFAYISNWDAIDRGFSAQRDKLLLEVKAAIQ